MQSTLFWVPVLLLLTLATAIAPLCAVSKGWAYYHTNHYNNISLQIWVRRSLSLLSTLVHDHDFSCCTCKKQMVAVLEV